VELRRIRFRQSGGFAGLVRGCEVAADALEAADRRALERYLRTTPDQPASAGPTVHDGVVFEISVECDDQTRHLAFSELSLPEELEALVAWLQRGSRPIRL
jgi:hypothetical protein